MEFKLKNPKGTQSLVKSSPSGLTILNIKQMKKKQIKPQTSKLKDGQVALFVDGLVIGGKCKFTVTK